MKNSELIIGLALMLFLIMVTICSSYKIATVSADKGYCYDQVGDGHHCYQKENRCEKAQKEDDIAESHCYREY
jgi:hypothetical protein